MSKKLFFLVSFISSCFASARASVDVTGSDFMENGNSRHEFVGQEEMLLHFSNSDKIDQFFKDNSCAYGVGNEIQSEDDVVVDLTNCDVIIVPPDVEILAAGNVWEEGGRNFL